MQDFAYALRILRKNPAFTCTAIVTLALGIGGNTAMFTLIRHVLLQPLAYRDPDRLVYFSTENLARNVHDGSFGATRLEEIRNTARSFTAIGAFLHSREEMTLSGVGDPEALKAARVSANFLDVLGVPPLAGRAFIADEDQRGGPAVAMISEALWRRRFSADPHLIGSTAILDAVPHTIVGVLPAGFDFPMTGVDVWVPRPSEWSLLPSRYWYNTTVLNGFARLKPGVTLDQAAVEMNVLNDQYRRAHPNPIDRDLSMRTVFLKDRLVRNVRAMLWTLFGAVGFVLLIACANVASLLMARATSRSREFAVRASLGAPRSRLIRQLLAESLVLAAAGGILGLLLAKWTLGAIRLAETIATSTNVMPLALPGATGISLDGTVLVFTVLLSIATGVLFGLAPALGASRPDLIATLRASGEAASRTPSRGVLGIRPRNVLVTGQIALSIVLLIGAALLIRSFARLHNVDTGFRTGHLLTMKIALPITRYDTDAKRAAFFTDLALRAAPIPGVRDAAVAMSLPTTTWIRTNITTVEGQPQRDPEETFAVVQSVTPGYFRTLGIPLRRGRDFTDRDNSAGAPPAVILNEALARRLWPQYPALNPVGLHIGEGYDKRLGAIEVIGIAADIREGGLGIAGVPEFYLPTAMHPPQSAYLAVRTAADPLGFVNAMRAQVAAIDRDQAVSEIRTMEDVLDASLGPRRLTTDLLGSFAAVALLLATLGIYGVIAYSVAQRTQEVGIRRALGAQRSDILRLILAETLGLATGGVAVGIATAFAFTRVIKTMLFEVSATDPSIFAGIAALFVLVSLAAGYLPARRAARIDPMSALR